MNDSGAIEAAIARALSAGMFEGWCITSNTVGGHWRSYRPVGLASPDDGFKIHVSASLFSAAEVLEGVMPILAEAKVPFKHTATLEQLALLSSGRAGLAQVGKFITAYPAEARIARKLAWQMHKATTGLRGPRIPNDIPLVDGSLVHFRYGAFTERWLQLPSGRMTLARLGEQGLEPDDRDVPAFIPPNVPAPFDPVDASASAGEARIVGGRYVRVQRLHASHKGSTWLGFALDDTVDGLVIIKEARAHVMEVADGSDAGARLKHEAEMLGRLASSGVTPEVVECWDGAQRAYLVYHLVEGPTFADVLHSLSAEGTRPSIGVLRDWAEQLCGVVATIHDAGFVVGDIKPANLIVTAEGFQLVDLELAGPPTTQPTGGIGTPGYASPQQTDPQCGRAYADDIYAIGATLLSAALLIDASNLPDSTTVAQYELRHDPANAFLSTLLRCLATEPSARFSSVRQICAAATADRSGEEYPSIEVGAAQLTDYLGLAQIIGDCLVDGAVPDRGHVHWISEHPIQQRQPGRDLYAGSAGIALYLCDLYQATADQRYLESASGCGSWLWEAPATYRQQVQMPGLYFGECGPGLLYLKLYLLTGDAEWASRALSVGTSVHTMPSHSPDLMTGEAGTGLYFLSLWGATGDPSILGWAGEIVDRLVSSREAPGFQWTIPPGHEGLSGHAYLGLSHGTAGIGYLIAEYAAATSDSGARQLCAEIADWLTSVARPCLEDGSGLTWPTTLPDQSPQVLPYWCHGAGGIARFLRSAYEATGEELIHDVLTRASLTVARTSSWIGTTQCHGLAGSAEALIDAWQCTRNEQWWEAAWALGENLVAYRDKNGWPTEYRNLWAPDLLVGQAGVGAAFLRLASPESPHLVSPAAFRSTPSELEVQRKWERNATNASL